MERWVGRVAIVTGASAGIGAAIAEALVKEGLLVVGLARRLENLDKLSASFEGAKGKLYARQCDVSKEDELLDAFEWVKTEFGGVDILVNNAGVAKHKRFIDDDIQSYRNMLNVNFLATAISVREAVASMQSRKVAGHIINVNSILGHPNASYPLNISMYPSSKYAMTALTDTVRRELANAKSKIKITSLSPGVVATELFELSGMSGVDVMLENTPHLQVKDIADAVVYILGTPENVQSVSPGLVKTEILKAATNEAISSSFFRGSPALNSEDVANAVIYALGTPPHVQICELTVRPIGEVLF